MQPKSGCVLFRFLGEVKLYQKLALKITDRFIQKNVISKDDREVYSYGYEILLSSVVYIGIMLAISIAFGEFFTSLIFFIGFYIYRKVAGGYHADTYFKCHLLFALNQLLFIVIIKFVHIPDFIIFNTSAAVIVCLITFLLAPIDNENKPFTENECIRYRRLSRVYTLLLLPVIVGMSFLPDVGRFVFCFCIGLLSANISLLYAYCERRVKNEKG